MGAPAIARALRRLQLKITGHEAFSLFSYGQKKRSPAQIMARMITHEDSGPVI